MPVARGYIRVSGDKQHESGLGEEAQRQAVYHYWEIYLQPKGVQWGGMYEDPAESAYTKMFLEKPQARQLFYAVRPGDYMIVARLDRAFRNTVDTLKIEAQLRAQSAYFVGLDMPGLDTSTPTGRFVLTIMAANAELQSAQTGERTKAAKAIQKKHGRYIGSRGKPYGYHVGPGKLLIPDQPERLVLEYLVRRHDMDSPRVYRWDRLAADVTTATAAGMLPKGRPWTQGKVQSAIEAFWVMVQEHGADWIVDPAVKQFAIANLSRYVKV